MDLTVRGHRFNVHRAGVAGPPVVMLHGAVVGNLMTWLCGVAPALSGSHRLLLLDARSHGLSQRCAQGHDVAEQARDVWAIAEAVFPGEAVALVGHSFGAVVALAAGRAEPQRTLAVAAVEPPLPPTDPGALERFLRQDPEQLRASLPAGGLLGAGRRVRRFAEHVRFLLEDTDLPLALERGLADPDAGALPVGIPLLGMFGDASPCLVAAGSLPPHAKIVVLPGGHFLPVEQAGAVAAELVRFLGEPRG